jgi:mono/diheme cytochrome c family protein
MTGPTTFRLAALLGGLLLVVAAVFARVVQPGARPVPAESPSAPASQPATTGAPATADLFEDACGACHTAASLSERLRSAPDPGAVRARFETFLRDHGETSDDDDRRILDWLSRPR